MASRRRAVLLPPLIVLALGLAGCGEERTGEEVTGGGASAQTQPATTAPEPQGGLPAGTQEAAASLVEGIEKAPGERPDIPKPRGAAPKSLRVSDLTVGDGPVVTAGTQMQVSYAGALWKTGRAFGDNFGSQPFPLVLGTGGVIPGWDQGLEGMRVGGRRLLVVPPDLAYGDAGQGDIGPGETLIFVVDAVA